MSFVHPERMGTLQFKKNFGSLTFSLFTELKVINGYSKEQTNAQAGSQKRSTVTEGQAGSLPVQGPFRKTENISKEEIVKKAIVLAMFLLACALMVVSAANLVTASTQHYPDRIAQAIPR